MVNLTGAYVGIVERNNDPEKLGRLKVRVPHAYGATGSEIGTISTDNLPWALPSGLPQGGTAASGAISWLPEPGDQVIVWFLDGEPEKPVWSWLMQTVPQSQSYTVNQYTADGDRVGKPTRAALTRYGHTLEFNAGSVISTTNGGYRVVLTDESRSLAQDGKITLATPKGNFIEVDDSTDTLTALLLEDIYFNADKLFTVLCEKFDVVTTNDDAKITSGAKLTCSTVGNTEFTAGADFQVTSTAAMSQTAGTTWDVSATSQATIASPLVQVQGDITNLGTGELQPFVGGTNMLSLLQTLILYLDTHTHSNGNNGAPTGTPIVPSAATLSSQLSSLVSTTVFGSM